MQEKLAEHEAQEVLVWSLGVDKIYLVRTVALLQKDVYVFPVGGLDFAANLVCLYGQFPVATVNEHQKFHPVGSSVVLHGLKC